jgi:uncharacterized membrane protein
MSKRLACWLAGSLFVLAVSVVLGPGSSPLYAQGKSGTVVVNASRHDQHALGPDDALPYSGGQAASNHEMVLRRTHAPGIAKKLKDPALQTSTSPGIAATSGVNVGGVGANGYAPPDTNGAAGATQYVQWVNVEFAVYNKSDGSLVYGPALGNSIWSGFGGSCQSKNSGDPIVEYDKQAGRWVMMQPVFSSPYSICVAVSTTSTWTKTGITWNRYQFNVPNNSTNFPDYPKLSVWPDGYYLSYNSFTNGNSWAGPQACVMDRSAMLAGQAATMQCAASPGLYYDGLLPSDLDGDVPGVTGTTQAPPAGSPAYFVGIYAGSNTELALFKFHVDWTTPSNSTFTGPTFVNIAAFNEACNGGTCIAQPNTSQKLDSLADRLMYRLAYRNFGDHESLVVSHSVDPGNGTSGIRWYEIRSPGSSPFVYQQGTFAPDSNYRWMPSIAMDKNGDIAVGYSESSSSVAPSIYYTGWQVGEPLGTLESEAPILQGAFSQTSGLSRWGDYSAMSVDPADDCTFWYTNEYLPYSGTFNWATQIASFAFPGCSSGSGSLAVSSVGLNPSSVTGGSPSVGTVTLNGAAPSDTSVTITSSNTAAATVPAAVTVLSGQSSANFNITTYSVSSSTSSNITASYNGSHASATLAVNSSGPPPSFALSAASGTINVAVNASNTDNITLTPSNGFTGSVSLSLSGLPPRTSSSFSVNPVSITGTGSAGSTLTISTNRRVTTGTYSLLVTATGSGVTQTLPLTLIIGSTASPDFSISASPSSQTVAPGSNVNFGVNVTASGGFTDAVTFSVSGLPANTTSSFSPTSVSGGSGTSTLTVTTSSSTPTGTYPVTITGTTSTNLTHSTQATLVVGSSSGGDFSLSASPSSQTISAGGSTSYSVTVAASGGFSGSVSLSVSGLPKFVSGSLSPSSVSGSGSSTLTVSTNRHVASGSYTLTITGTSGSLSRPTTVQLVVQ